MTQNSKDKIKNWWASNPMTYGVVHGQTEYAMSDVCPSSSLLGTPEFFDLADRRFYGWNTALHNAKGKFGYLFDYDRYRYKNVLEIGCGMGCMAMNWAQHGARMTAIDLNTVSVEQTRRRFQLFGIDGTIQEMDARRMSFSNDSFDFVYSWGVLHHSPQIEESIAEMHRVMKPGGTMGVMLYNRHSLLYLYTIKLIEGYLHQEDSFLRPLELASRYGDGAREEGNPHTWPVTREEINVSLFSQFQNVKVEVMGADLEFVFDLAFPRLGSWVLPKSILRALGRRWGWSLWITGTKA